LEALKPLLVKHGLTLTVSDSIEEIGGRVYVKASCSVGLGLLGDKELEVTAFAREEMSRKGMDAAQITGTASSYARKYALNGMFLIDDQKDADSSNTHEPKTPADFIEELTVILKETSESPELVHDYLLAVNAVSGLGKELKTPAEMAEACSVKVRDRIIKNPQGFWKAVLDYKKKREEEVES